MNLNPEENAALKSLRSNTDIVIKPADKGGAIVIQNTVDYIQEAHRQLYDLKSYSEVPRDLNPAISKKITKFLIFVKEQQLLPEEVIKYLLPKNERTPIFYTLPKIHKTGNPGRPIVSQIGSCTEKLSEFVDYHLKPIAMNTNSYIIDTNDFLRKIQNLGPLPPGSILCTADVSALYTSIPHTDGIRAAKVALDNRDEPNKPPTWIILRMIQLILMNNCFRFSDKYFLQKQGTAMGTKMAPNYAIVFMDYLETRFLSTCKNIPLVWWRYIDDIFFIWQHGTKDLEDFMQALNSHHPTIKFTSETSETEVNFLDTTIYLEPDGNLGSKLYNKPTNAFLYLHYRSCHPGHQKRSIPFSQALRIKKICSKPDDFELEILELFKRFKKRGYPSDLLHTAIAKVRRIPREQLLTPKENSTTRDVLPFVIPYNPRNPDVKNILDKYKHVLLYSPETTPLTENKLIVAFSRTRSIRNILVKSDLAPNINPTGNQPCGRNCKICPRMVHTKTFRSKVTGKVHKVTGHIDCRTVNAIYLITCKNCGKQYVGQTSNSINTRVRNHLYDIANNAADKPVAAHFNEHGHNAHDVTITGITAGLCDVNKRLRTEEAWIFILQTKSQRGLNLIT